MAIPRTLVREDEQGLYLVAGGVKARPGSLSGYGHAWRMDDGGLKAGDKVVARHRGGTPLVSITLPDGGTTIWGDDYEHRRGQGTSPPAEARWKADGSRDFGTPVSGRESRRKS